MAKDPDSTVDFGAMLERDLQNFHRDFKPGQKLTGTVTAIDDNAVFVDIGGRSEGVLSREEATDKQGRLTAEEGESITVFFVGDRDGEVRLTTRIGSQADSGQLLDAWENGIPVEGKVIGEINGGFEVEVGGHRGFCPYSQIDLRRGEAASYIGEKYLFSISQADNSLRNLVLSRRELLEQEQAQAREKLREELEPGMILEGEVRRIMPFGVFVDLGAGVDGLVPLRELAWGHKVEPGDLVAPGDRVSVMVRELDWEKNRISLSLRYAVGNPWEDAAAKYPVGGRFVGTVVKLMPFGAFVELEPGIEGLLHISKLGGGRRVNHPREVLEEGARIEVVVENLDGEAQKIGLALIGAEDDGEAAAQAADLQAERERQGKEKQSFGSLGDLLGDFKV